MRGWSINVSVADASASTFEVDLPTSPLYYGCDGGAVIELVYWSDLVRRWMHLVAEHFERTLPSGHVQVALGDFPWIDAMVKRLGQRGLQECLRDLEQTMDPAAEAE